MMPDDSVIAATTTDGDIETEQIGGQAREHGASRISQIAPEPIHAHGCRAPGRMRHIANRREERQIHHRRSDAERDGAHHVPSCVAMHTCHSKSARKAPPVKKSTNITRDSQP